MVAQPKSIGQEEPWGSLSDEERIAVELTAAGWKQQDIAEHLGVHRTTIYRYLKKSSAGKYLSYMREERTTETRLMMAEATNLSVRAILEAAKKGDAKVGLAWLSLGPIYWKHFGTV